MFKKASLFAIIFLGACAAFWLKDLVVVTPKDLPYYRKAVLENLSAPQKNLETTSQLRQNVRKDFWVAQGSGKRLHHRIESSHSSLTFTPNGKKSSIIENLDDIFCWIQEDNSSKKLSQVKFLRAQKGLYDYNQQSFSSPKMRLAILNLDESKIFIRHDLKTALFSGLAENLSLSVHEKFPTLHADHVKASLKTPSLEDIK